MSKQESFKRKVRERMLKTGERYVVARQALLNKSQKQNTSKRKWIAEPDMTDESVTAKTGKGYDQWCDIIESWNGDKTDHTAVARYLVEEHKVDSWWAQGITVGYERITGLRLPFQRKDGTFSASKSKTVFAGATYLHEMLTNETDRAELFPGKPTKLLSRPGAKTIRLEIGQGVALIRVDELADDKSKVAIEHEKLLTYESVLEWKHYWTEWLDAAAAATE